MTYSLLRHIEFDSARRMMTMVVADEVGEVYVFSKGADSSILPLIRDKENSLHERTC